MATAAWLDVERMRAAAKEAELKYERSTALAEEARMRWQNLGVAAQDAQAALHRQRELLRGAEEQARAADAVELERKREREEQPQQPLPQPAEVASPKSAETKLPLTEPRVPGDADRDVGVAEPAAAT